MDKILFVYSKSLNLKGTISDYISLIWKEEYCGRGSFTLTLASEGGLLGEDGGEDLVGQRILRQGRYIYQRGKKTAMVIRRIHVNEKDGTVTVNGYTTLDILRQRVIPTTWGVPQVVNSIDGRTRYRTTEAAMYGLAGWFTEDGRDPTDTSAEQRPPDEDRIFKHFEIMSMVRVSQGLPGLMGYPYSKRKQFTDKNVLDVLQELATFEEESGEDNFSCPTAEIRRIAQEPVGIVNQFRINEALVKVDGKILIKFDTRRTTEEFVITQQVAGEVWVYVPQAIGSEPVDILRLNENGALTKNFPNNYIKHNSVWELQYRTGVYGGTNYNGYLLVEYQPPVVSQFPVPIQLGMRMNFDVKPQDNESRKHIFEVYGGRNLTDGNPDGNKPIRFVAEWGGLSNIELENDKSDYANIAYVAGEGEGENRVRIDNIRIEESKPKNIDRFELAVDARDLQSEQTRESNVRQTEQSETTVAYDNRIQRLYKATLQERAKQKLFERSHIDNFVCDIDTEGYGTDFELGDIVTCVSKKHGKQINVRITQITEVTEGGVLRVIATLGTPELTLMGVIKRHGT